MHFDILDAPGANECFKCGGEVVAYGSVNATGQAYYLIRCEVCCVQGNSGPSVEWAVKFWNEQGVYDGERLDFKKHSQTGRVQGEGEGSGGIHGNVRLARLEERIARYNENKAASRARQDARKNAKGKGKVDETAKD